MNRKRIALAAGAAAVIVAGAGGVAVASGAIGDDDEKPIEGRALEQAEKAALEETGGGRVTETEQDDEESRYEVEVTLEDGSQVDVQLDGNFDVVGSERDDDSADGDAPGDDDGRPIEGPALEQAEKAALAETAGGRVTETEGGDDGGSYEVEVTLDDGSQVDVYLDENFNVIRSEPDEGPGDD